MTLHYVSLFSGIEAFSVAASRIRDVNWRPVFFSEIDPFASAVLQHHFPDVPNLGDVCGIHVNPENNTVSNHDTTIPLPGTGIDVLAGGSPCQDVSVAGKRAGMSPGGTTRSSLAFEYARLVRELRPRLILWENVPGVRSSNQGRDFGAFLRTLDELGYGLAWRSLDVQHTAVDSFPRATPQRRDRVWLVGCLGGDGRIPAEILFEPERLLGDTPPRREAGKGFAAPAGYGPPRNGRMVGSGGATPFDRLKRNPPIFGDGGASRTLTSHTVMDAGMEDLVVSASFDGENCSPTLRATNGTPGQCDQELFSQKGAYLARCMDMTHADEAIREVEGAVAVRTANTHANGHGVAEEVCHTLDRAQGQVVAVGFSHVASGAMLDCRPDANAVPLKCSPGGEGAVAVDSYNQTASEEVMHTIHHHDGLDNQPKVVVKTTRYIVRRLTPGECETLQAFPQGWTRIPYRGKPPHLCPDSPRYKALGNSWGTNCAEWILRRIVAAFRLGLIEEGQPQT